MTIDMTRLRGQHVYLKKLDESHREMLRPLARDERIWEFTRLFLINNTFDAQFDAYFNTALDPDAMGGQQVFAIFKTSGDEIIGMTRYYMIDEQNKRLEIGYTWYIPAVWTKVYNKECKLLLLQHAFEDLGMNRVQFTVAGQNIRSQKAVEKIGGFKEGVLRKHSYRNDGTLKDTVMYSIINDEWPVKKEKLIHLVSKNEKE